MILPKAPPHLELIWRLKSALPDHKIRYSSCSAGLHVITSKLLVREIKWQIYAVPCSYLEVIDMFCMHNILNYSITDKIIRVHHHSTGVVHKNIRLHCGSNYMCACKVWNIHRLPEYAKCMILYEIVSLIWGWLCDGNYHFGTEAKKIGHHYDCYYWKASWTSVMFPHGCTLKQSIRQTTHWGRDKMAAFSQTKFWHAFSWT